MPCRDENLCTIVTRNVSGDPRAVALQLSHWQRSEDGHPCLTFTAPPEPGGNTAKTSWRIAATTIVSVEKRAALTRAGAEDAHRGDRAFGVPPKTPEAITLARLALRTRPRRSDPSGIRRTETSQDAE